MLKILHIADIHARDNDLDEIEKCLNHIAQVAENEAPDLIVNAGDTFDSQNVKLDSRAAKLIFRIFSRLADVAPVAIVIGTPSHDGLAAEVLRHVRARHRVWVSTFPEQILLLKGPAGRRLAGPGEAGKGELQAAVSMLPTPTKQFLDSGADIAGSDQEIARAMNDIFAGFGAAAAVLGDAPHILVGHFQVGGAYISETQQLTGRDIEIHPDQITLADPDLVCLGHIHLKQRIGSNIFYSGSIFRKDFGELESKGFYIHLLDRDPRAGAYALADSRFIETPTRKLLKLSVDGTGAGFDFATDLDPLYRRFTFEEMEGAHIRVEIKAYQDEAGKIDRERITGFFTGAGAASLDLRIIRIPRENVRSRRILKLQTLREKLVEMAALRGESVSEGILAKADLLESLPPDQVIARAIQGGAP